MLALNARFALLAAFLTLATLTFSPRWGVGAAAIQSRSFDRDYCHVVDGQPSSQHVLPLPLQSRTKQFKRDNDTPRVECKFRRRSHHSDPAEIARRSVLIPDNHGSEYLVSHSRRPVSHHRRRPGFRKLSGIKQMPLSRRKEDTMMGIVALLSPVEDSDTGKQIATLLVAPDGTLYASETDKTHFELVNVPGSESISDLTPVTLEAGQPGTTHTCATYNASPESDTQNMVMKPCADRASPEASDESQIFMYNGTSGTLEPTLNSGADGANTTAAISPANRNSTLSSNGTATSSALQTGAALPAKSTKQNSTVTLVFKPVKAMDAHVGIQDSSTTTGDRITTVTMTKTVTVSQATTTSSALDVQLVGAPSPMPSPDATGSTTMGSASPTSSSTVTRSIDAAAIASGIAASVSASASSASAAASSTSSSTDSASPSSTQAVRRREDRRMDSKVTTISTEPYTWMFKAEAVKRDNLV